MTDIFDKIGNAENNLQKNNWIPPGEHLLFVDTLKLSKSHDEEDIVVSVFDIVESNVPECVGTTRDNVYNLTKNTKYAHKDVRSMLAAIGGYDPDIDEQRNKITPERVKLMLGEENPAHGRLVRCKAWDKPKKNTPQEMFTHKKFSPVPEEMQAKATELRKNAGFMPF